MKQKVYVQGRETQPVRVQCSYVPPKDKRNSFSDIGFSWGVAHENPGQKGFHVRHMGDEASEGDMWKKMWEE